MFVEVNFVDRVCIVAEFPGDDSIVRSGLLQILQFAFRGGYGFTVLQDLDFDSAAGLLGPFCFVISGPKFSGTDSSRVD